jgi:hypothetical protein
MSTTGTAAPSATADSRVQAALVALAIVHILGAISDLPTIFNDYEHDTRLLKIAQGITTARTVIGPLFPLAALYFAVKRRLPAAIIMFAADILVTWLGDLPSIAIHGFELSPDIGGISAFCVYFVAPAIAVAAILLARANRRLGLATFLVALPALAVGATVLAFGISVALYGF